MKVAILGTRGIPNYYGGFEQFAEYFSTYLAAAGHTVYVYCPHNHPYKEATYSGVNLVRCFDPEYKIGTAGQFVYDLNCIRHSRKLKPDVILNLGYTSSAVFMRFLKKSIPVVTNMDGLEWKRSKYGRWVQKFIKYSEGIAVRRSKLLISDSLGIKEYLLKAYNQPSVYIPYGADVPEQMPDAADLAEFELEAFKYNLVIARMEPENNLETILTGVLSSSTKNITLVIGNYKTGYGSFLYATYHAKGNIRFIGPYYDLKKLNALRYYCNIYFHGHSVGGTNPSLLEAMASHAFICAHRNEFNAHILGPDALYFSDSNEVKQVIEAAPDEPVKQKCRDANVLKIKTIYKWPTINKQYETTLQNAIALKK